MLKISSSRRWTHKFAVHGDPLFDPDKRGWWFKLPRLLLQAQNAINAEEIDDLIEILTEISRGTGSLADEYEKLLTEQLRRKGLVA